MLEVWFGGLFAMAVDVGMIRSCVQYVNFASRLPGLQSKRYLIGAANWAVILLEEPTPLLFAILTHKNELFHIIRWHHRGSKFIHGTYFPIQLCERVY